MKYDALSLYDFTGAIGAIAITVCILSSKDVNKNLEKQIYGIPRYWLFSGGMILAGGSIMAYQMLR